MINLNKKIIRRPALYFAVSISCGILLSYYSHNSYQFLFKIVQMFLIIYFFYYSIFKLRCNKKSIYVWLLILFLLIGFFSYYYQEYKYQSRDSIINFAGCKSAEIFAEISFDIGDLESDKVYLKPYYINNRKVKYGKILIYSKKISKNFADGDLISLKLTLNKAEPELNPGGFSNSKYLKNKGVYLQGWKPAEIRLLDKNPTFKNYLIKFKKKLLFNINQLFKAESSAFIKAILLGEKEYLSFEQKNLLRNAGASHLLAISGLHMGIIILSFSLIFFRLCSKRKNGLYFLTAVTVVYIILVGAAVSVIRASLLALLFLWADEFNRSGDFLNITAFTLVVNLLITPSALFTVSLQLSYLIVFSLYYITPLLNRVIPGFLAVSLAAQLGSFAVAVFYFNEYSWIAVLTNLWVIPYISVLLPLIFIIILFSLISINLLASVAFIIEFALKILFVLLEFMTELQGLPLVIAAPNLFHVFIYYICLFLLPVLYQKYYIYFNIKKKLFQQKVILIIFVLTLILFFIKIDSGLLEIDFISVGQGDGIFIKFPDGKNMLIDTGPSGSDGCSAEYTIVSYLNYIGVRNLDYVLISHFDADHVGGLIHLLKRKEIDKILIPPFKQKTIYHYQLEKEMKANKNVKIEYLTENMNLKISGCKLQILNPERRNLFQDRNENSAVLLLKFGLKKFLFTGDLSKKGENRIAKTYELNNLDVLKIGHHGSNTSTGEKLLAESSPRLAVISVGENNFGHPSPQVISRLNKFKVKHFRTDRDGLVKVISNGKNIFFKTYR